MLRAVLLACAYATALAATDILVQGVTLTSQDNSTSLPAVNDVVYLRCHPTSKVPGEDHAGTADRYRGFHASLPIEEVTCLSYSC